MRDLTSFELHAVSGGAVAVEARPVIRVHILPEQARFDYAPPPMRLRPRPVK